MNRKILDDLTYATLLSLERGKWSGSGFFLNIKDIDYLITAKHVLFNEDELKTTTLTLTSQNARGIDTDARIFNLQLTKEIILKSDNDDVVAIPIGNIEKEEFLEYVEVAQKGTLKPFSITAELTKVLDEIQIANEVYLVGFPTSLLFQNTKLFDPGKALLRKGIISGINAADNTFIVDCPVYYGNSGAPMLEVCEDGELRVIGIVTKYIPLVVEWRNSREMALTQTEYINSGYSVCVPINAINEILSK